MGFVKEYNKIVIKIGTSTLTHATGALNLDRMESLVLALSDFKNAGKQIVLVSSGAVSAGIAKMNVDHRPRTVEEKQAMAAVGQSELMKMYDRFFSTYGHTVGQILMTKDVIDNAERRHAVENTFRVMLEMGCVPIVNENDSVSSEEIKFGGNDTLSAYVSLVSGADLLINLSDIDGLYDSDPRKNPDAKLVERVDVIDEAVLAMAGGAGTERGTGGMAAKIKAAKIVSEAGIPMIIANGTDPHILYDILKGEKRGTFFAAAK